MRNCLGRIGRWLTALQQIAYPEFRDNPIIGGKDCEAVTRTPENGSTFNIGDIKVTALYTPCHTQDSICYLMEDTTGIAVFTGDTLFHGGMWLLIQHPREDAVADTWFARLWQVFRRHSRGDAHSFEQDTGFLARGHKSLRTNPSLDMEAAILTGTAWSRIHKSQC